MAFSSKMLVSTALACILVALTLNPGLGNGAAQTPRTFTAPVQEFTSPPEIGTSIPYVGLRGCSASACHGRNDRAPGDSIWQNEYQTWAGEDKHSNAFLLLYNENSQAMGQRLGLGNPVGRGSLSRLPRHQSGQSRGQLRHFRGGFLRSVPWSGLRLGRFALHPRPRTLPVSG